MLTPSDHRQYDSQPHVEYIRKIIDNGSIPQTADCWQCYHPPIYYLTAASLFRLLPPPTPAYGDRMLQRMALILFLSFELIGLSIILPLFPSRRSKLTAGVLFALWPSGILHSARIGNDLMLYPMQAASLYCLLHWRETKDKKWLYAALALALLCSLIKFNGLLSLMLIVLVSLYDGWREHQTIAGSLKKALSHFSFLYPVLLR